MDQKKEEEEEEWWNRGDEGEVEDGGVAVKIERAARGAEGERTLTEAGSVIIGGRIWRCRSNDAVKI